MLPAQNAVHRTVAAFQIAPGRCPLAARHALQAIADGLRAHRGAPERTVEMTAAIHAVELQLPEAWLPFVVGKRTARARRPRRSWRCRSSRAPASNSMRIG